MILFNKAVFIVIGCLCFFRAIVAHKGKVIPLSRDFTPESERQRVQLIVRMVSCIVSVIFRVKVTACKVLIVILFIISGNGCTCRKY